MEVQRSCLTNLAHNWMNNSVWRVDCQIKDLIVSQILLLRNRLSTGTYEFVGVSENNGTKAQWWWMIYGIAVRKYETVNRLFNRNESRFKYRDTLLFHRQEATVFIFDKKSVEKLYRPKRRDQGREWQSDSQTEHFLESILLSICLKYSGILRIRHLSDSRRSPVSFEFIS